MKNINICYTCDNNYAVYTGVSIASILKNSKEDESLHFFIIESCISDENKQKILNLKKIKNFEITFIRVDESEFKEFTCIKTTNYLPAASFYRLKIPALVRNVDKILYLDPDTIVNKSLADLYDTDIENYIMGGVFDIGYKKLGKRIGLKGNEFYINSGVLLINLKKCREENFEEKLIQCAKENMDIFILGDQDLINKCYAGQILHLSGKWNVQVVNLCSRSDYSQNFNILHYTGGAKPWKSGSYIPLKKYYFEYLKYTDWESPDKLWHLKSNIKGAFLYLKHRPLFMFRPGFYKSLMGMILKK